MNEANIAIEEITVKPHLSGRMRKVRFPCSASGIEEIEKSPGGNRDISKVLQSLPV